MKVVLANGCFDVLHKGHIEHLRQAKSMGDFLVVSLTADEYVNKGPKRPINTWKDRAEVLMELRCVDAVFSTKNAVEAIENFRHDIFVKGIDYADGNHFTEDVESACKKAGSQLRFTTTEKRSVTELINRLQDERNS